MGMMALLDDSPYPWHIAAAQQLHETLISLYPSGQAALLFAKRAQIDTTWILEQQPIAPLWKDILESAARENRLRALVSDVHDRLLEDNPVREFLGEILANRSPPTSAEPRDAEGAPRFVHDDDEITEPEALLFRDDLTLPIGQLPGLIATLEKLVKLAPAVCKLTVNVNQDEQYGTGFRVGEDLLLTNWHVLHRLNDGAPATTVTAEFGFEDDGNGHLLAARPVRCQAESVAADEDDDWAVVRVLDALDPRWPVIKLSEAAAPTPTGAAFIIQHPRGQRKRVGFVRNQVSYFDDRIVQYLTDTEAGSSGSPVINAQGQLIALHHQGGRPRILLGKPPLRKNEGIRISRIVQGLRPYRVSFA